MTKTEYHAQRFEEVTEKAKFFIRNFSKLQDRAKRQYRDKEISKEEWLEKDTKYRLQKEAIQKLFR